MADRRIRIAADRTEILRRLKVEEKNVGVFRDYTDALAFAAAYGAARNRREPLGEVAATPAPIRYSVFKNDGYDALFYLLAVHATGSAEALASGDETEDKRALIFEEYANGGLVLLDAALRGLPEPLDGMALLLSKELHASTSAGPPRDEIGELIGD